MKGNYRLTPLGVGVLILLLAAIVAMVFGSRGLQAAGFIVIVLVICLGAMALLSSAGGNFTVLRRGGYSSPSGMLGGRAVRAASLFDPEHEHNANPGEPAGADRRQEEERHRERGSGRGELHRDS